MYARIFKKDFQKIDEGKICGNCGHFNKCNDRENKKNFDLVNKYFDLKMGFGFSSSNQFQQEHLSLNQLIWNYFHLIFLFQRNFY